jgi:hypothetical protein
MNTKTDEVLSIKEVADSFSEGLPDWQRKINLDWLTSLTSLMSEGGIWGSPNLGKVYRKSGDGWVLMEDLSD